MIVTYFGNSYLKFQVGSYVIAVNPPKKGSGVPVFGADVVLCSALDEMHHGVETVTFGAKTPFLIDGPGEYEVGDIFIRGVGAQTKAHGYVTSYSFKFDDISVCIIAPVSNIEELGNEFYEIVEDVGILCVPIAGGDFLDSHAAHKLAVSLEAKLVIPLGAEESKADKDALSSFLKESGAKDATTMDKLTIKKSELGGKECVPVVLSAMKKGD